MFNAWGRTNILRGTPVEFLDRFVIGVTKSSLPMLSKRDPSETDSTQVGHVPTPGGQVIDTQLVEMLVPARAGQYLHEFDGRTEESVESPRGVIDD
jgi:hypothetical protein